MNRPLAYSLGGLAVVASAFTAGRYTVPTRVEWKTEYVERVQTIRLVQVDRKVDTRWKTVVVSLPDGSSTSTTEAVAVETTKSTDSSKIASSTKATESKVTVATDKNWSISGLVGLNLAKPVNSAGSVQPIFGVTVGRRIVGPLWGEVIGQTNGVFSLGLGLTF